MPDWSSWRSLEKGDRGSFSKRFPKIRGVYQIALKGTILRRHSKYVGKATSIYGRLNAHVNHDGQVIGEYIALKGRDKFEARFALEEDGIDPMTGRPLKGFKHGLLGDYDIVDEEAYLQWFQSKFVPWRQNEKNVRDETCGGKRTVRVSRK